MELPASLYDTALSDLRQHLSYDPVGLSSVPPTATDREYACHAFLLSLTKKFLPKDTRDADSAALEKFLASNKKCESWSLPLNTSGDELLVGLFREELQEFFCPNHGRDVLINSYADILDRAACGPGTAVGTKETSFYGKLFGGPMACTDQTLYKMYKAYTWLFPEFSIAETIRREDHGEPRTVLGSRSSFVPKTSKISRMICSEPSLNMYYQLGLGDILSHRLMNYFGINLSTQPETNKRLARLGSITGEFATIDLESASDSISMKMLKEFLPAWIYEMIELLRSPNTLIKGRQVKLEMVSTMGNGFTFPLQTVIFSCLVAAAYKSHDMQLRSSTGEFSVFGDDIIVRRKCVGRVYRLLELLGFTVNRDKSFTEGLFRESCGADWFNGQPVRGVYIKSLSSPRDYAVAFNLVARWSAVHNVLLPRTLTWLLSHIPKRLVRVVPRGESLDAGIHVPLITARSMVRLDRNKSRLYEAWVARQSRIKVRGDSLYPSKLSYNPPGLLLSVVAGFIRDSSILIRSNVTGYGTRRRISVNWDFPYNGFGVQGPPTPSEEHEAWRRWNTVVDTVFTLYNTPSDKLV